MTITLNISISNQTLDICEDDANHDSVRIVNRHWISTAANRAGEIMDSGCTPTGRHIIRAKIGEGMPVNTVFRGRRPSGEIYQFGMRDAQPDRDWILSRILWLSGCEPGKNRLKDRDTMRRYIYIHGTPDEVEMGVPGSRGCIRMRNAELLTLFDVVSIGTPVNIYV